MQIRAIKTPKQAEDLLNDLPLIYTIVCLAQVLTLTAKLYPQVKEQILKDEELVEILRNSKLFIQEDLADFGEATPAV